MSMLETAIAVFVGTLPILWAVSKLEKKIVAALNEWERAKGFTKKLRRERKAKDQREPGYECDPDGVRHAP